MHRWLLGLGTLALIIVTGVFAATVRDRYPPVDVTRLPTLAPSAVADLPPAAGTPSLTLPPTFTPQQPQVEQATSTPYPTLPPTNTPAVSSNATVAPTPTPLAGVTLAPTLRLQLQPGDPIPYLQTFRLIAFYGVTSGPELGVLGVPPRTSMMQQLQSLAAQYQALSPDRMVLPTFHIVTTIADGYPGDFGTYSHRSNEAVLAEWIATARSAGLAVVLDIQPGFADIGLEVERLRPYLYDPHVHLALDSEFVMAEGEIPGRELGQLEGYQINSVQETLERIALETGLNKVLIIHQFDPIMVLSKETIRDYPHVELVFDADGFGAPEAKIQDYVQYSMEPGFEYGGFKLFFNWDTPLLDPAGVMTLQPVPAVIIYQ